MAKQKINTKEIGKKYEDIAASYLAQHGYTILERNYHNRYGELDIIAEKQNILIYCEVRYRNTEQYGGALESVDIRKQQKLCRTAALHYATNDAARGKCCRFDVIGISNDKTIRHIKNAFEFQDEDFF